MGWSSVVCQSIASIRRQITRDNIELEGNDVFLSCHNKKEWNILRTRQLIQQWSLSASLWAALRSSTHGDYVLPRFIFFIFFFYSTLVLKNYRTDFHQIFRNCVFWCSLNNPVVFKILRTPSRGEKRQKQRKFGQNFTGWLRFLTITSKQWKIIQIWNKLELGEWFLYIFSKFHSERFEDSWDPFAQWGDKICIFVKLLHFLS